MLHMPSISDDYYQREKVYDPVTGQWSFETDKDIANKRAVAARLIKDGLFDTEKETSAIVETSKYHAIDWYVYGSKTKTLNALVEIKSRTCKSTRYEDAFFNLRKYNALMSESKKFNVPSFFMLRYTDCVKMVYVPWVDATRVQQKAGCSRYVKSEYDVEPCILLPVESMTLVYSF